MNTPHKLPFALTPPFAILGYGVEGKYTVNFLKQQGLGPITVLDQKKRVDLPQDLFFIDAAQGWGDLTRFGTVFRSPGVHYATEEIQMAREAGITITSLSELTFECARQRISAITGSNGKTTTTNLTAHLLKQQYDSKMIVGGNDHQPVLQEVLNRPIDPVLMEVSSFQCADLKISPHIAALLNITPNHLDWHDDLEDYAHAKRNLMEHQKPHDWVLLNANDENTAKCESSVKGKLMWIGQEKGEHWIQWQENRLIAHFNGQKQDIIDKETFSLKTHPDNIAFAAGLALIHSLHPEQIRQGIKSFKGVEHRMEYVGEKGGVKFYNDSACTTPESAQVVIEQFEKSSLILLLGGSSKNSEFDYLALDLKKNQVRVFLYGEEAKRIETALKAQGAEESILNQDHAADFKVVVQQAFQMAKAGDSVVLSPACASFDRFKNSKERGQRFKEIVREILTI